MACAKFFTNINIVCEIINSLLKLPLRLKDINIFNYFQKIIQLCIKNIKFTLTFKWFVLLLTDYFLFFIQQNSR